MKTIVMSMVLFLQVLCLYAQGGNTDIETQIRTLENRENKAILIHDTVSLQQVWAPDFMVNVPFNRVTLSSRELLEMVNNGTIRFSSFTRNIEHIMVKKDIVITMGSEEVVFTGNIPNAGRTIKRRFSHLWMKQKGEWRLTARHANNICPE